MHLDHRTLLVSMKLRTDFGVDLLDARGDEPNSPAPSACAAGFQVVITTL